MKSIIFFLILVSVINASIDITQNMRALYKGIELTEVQEEYILDNQDKNIDIFKRVIKKEIRQFKSLSDKNIISFMLTPAGEVSDIKFLKTSSNRKLDRTIKKAINKVAKNLIRPEEITELRYIISYEVGQRASYSNVQASSKTREPYYQKISRGTTRFQYQSKEYIRVFETTRDGFINMTQEPRSCAKRVTILRNNGQEFAKAVGNLFSEINKETPKGKYKILIQTRKTCNINLEYQ